jgi:hypothetical protein
MTDGNYECYVPSNVLTSTWAGLRPHFVNELLTFKQALANGIDRLPATSVLYRAYITRLESWIAALDNAPESWNETAEALNSEILELRSYILAGLREKKEFRSATTDMLGVILNSAGFSYPQTRHLVESPPATIGAPAGNRTSREVYLTACDLWLGGNWSYREITNRLCECGEQKHGGNCKDRFLKGIKAVRKLIEKYTGVMPQKLQRQTK